MAKTKWAWQSHSKEGLNGPAGWVGLSIADQQRKIRVLQMRDIPSTFFVSFCLSSVFSRFFWVFPDFSGFFIKFVNADHFLGNH